METQERDKILLESGTNEIEVMKFTVQGEFYGINVAKVQEIIMSSKVKPMPHAHPSVEGIFKPRDTLITVTNLDLTSSFAAIANGGNYIKPQFFTKILDHNGKVLFQNDTRKRRVLKDSTAFLLTDAMAASMQSNRKFSRPGVNVNSTSTSAALPNMSCAGKSGTTTAYNDIWFVGYTPYYTAGVWGGCDNNQKLRWRSLGFWL